jgi:RecJ-like exonuclease
MSLEYEIDDDCRCSNCGHSPIHFRTCQELGCEEGWFDESEEEYCLPGTVMAMCQECNGTGIEKWCPKCGKNLSGLELECEE